MRRILFCLLFLLGSFSLSVLSQSASDMLIMMPDDLIPQLTVNNRKDMVDFAKLDRADNVMNRFGGHSRITSLSENFLEVSLSEQSSMQLKILPYRDTIIVGVIHTVSAPVRDSRIAFYTTDWEDMQTAELWEIPDAEDFAATKKSKDFRDAISLLDMWLAEYSFDKDDDYITVRQTVGEYLPEEIAAKVTPYLSDQPLRYEWTGKRFKKAKQ